MLRLRPRHASFVLAASLLLGAASAARAQVARYSHTMTVMSDGNTLIVGGKGAGNTSLTTVDIYISTGAKYETRAVLNTARSSHTATLLPDGQVLVTGGVNAAGTILNDGELYNPRLNTWTNVPTGSFAGPRVNHTATLLPNGTVLIAGGQTDAAGNVLTACAIYSPSATPFGMGSFSPCGVGGAMQMGRAAHTATLLHNGRVFVVGGYRGPGSGFAPTTELYDFNTDTWLSGPAVSARAYHTATQMGNQRVLISGGFNRVNLLENQGILSTNEIYDPNSNSIIGGTTPMAERRMMHTAVLGADGVVSLYGGLGNFTTTYIRSDQTMRDNSVLRLNAVAGTWLAATVDNVSVGPDTDLLFQPNITMSVAANGTIVDGDINFSSPTMSGTDFRANFTFPNGTVAALDGATLENGVLADQTLEIDTVGGNVAFAAQTVSSDDVILTAGSLATALAIPPATATPLVPGTSSLSGTIRVVLPVTNIGGSVLVGAAIITQGAISRISNEVTQGFDVALTSGVASIVGGNVVQDPEDGAVMSLAVNFSGVAGDITSSTTTNIATPVNVTGLKVEGLQLRLMYVISPLNVSGLSLANDIATVTVRTMVFADQERYRPDQNSWAFGAPGGTIFNHGQVGLPNGDQFFYGGRNCTSVANCTAGTFTATNERSAYINLNHEVVSWQTTSGILGSARSNLTLTQLPDGRALAAGGANASTTLDASEAFDPVNRVWVPTAKMKRSRSHHTATLLPNGNVLVAGGFTALGNSTGTTSHAEIFYPPSGAWVHTAPMLSSRAFHAAVLLPDGNPMFLGGFSNGSYLSSTEVFYSTSHRWYQGSAMPEPRGQFTATVLHDGRIMVVGGLNAANGVLNSTRFFNPTTLAWSAGGALNFARHSHTATLLRDGRVFVVGGNDGTNEIALGEIYNPATDAWSRVTTLGGNDLSIPRQNHTATLLPDGKVMIVGGFTALGGAITFNEGFDVDFSSFQMQGQFQQTGKRGDHATILLPDGNLLTAGGFDGLNYLNDTSLMYHGSFPDSLTLAGGLVRRPRIDAARPAIIAPDTPVTVVGDNFRGVTEASGGGSASQNSSHAHPRVYMNRAEAASSSGNDSGWMVDLTSGMFHSGVNTWTNMNSSLTFRVPETALKLPYGWYHLRVGANNQFSVSSMVLVGPQLPTGTPGIPVGTAVGAASVSWTWAAAAGTFDGYSIYSATSGVFISTLAKSGGATETFLQRDLGPDTSTLIRVAAYNIAGDGSFAVSTVPVLTAVSNVNGLVGLAQDARSIFWSWDPVAGALGYEVYSSSAGVRINSPVASNFTQTGLSTNTVSSVRVLAVMPGGIGALSESATTFTLAASPVAGSPSMNNVSTGSFTTQWLPNTNPTNTLYHLQILVGALTVPVQVSSLTGLTAGITGLEPNSQYTLSVAAINGDGRFTGFTALGSTYTLARPPLNPRILAADPSGISLAWDANGNPGTTPYQILYSSDNFTTATISTHIAFSAGVTTTSTNVGSLITAKTYVFRISARNAFGQETSAASTSAFTDNGGGPAGSLSILAPTTVYTSLAGTLGSARRFEIRIPERTFDVDTRIFISSRAVGVGGVNCGNIGAAFSITNLPAVQPKLPVEVGIQYVPGETGLGAVTTLGMARYDPVSGACVPMESRVDTTNNILYARLNHFSDFQLQQLVPGAAVATARVFPNPLYTHTQPFFTFDHIPAATKVRIFTIHGEEVFDQSANASGIITWRAENKVGRPVASGLYLAVVESGGEKKILKLAVVR